MSLSLTLQQLVAPWLPLADFAASIAIKQLELDSRKVVQGTTFVAIKGHAVDGRQFIDAALNNGATSVIAEACHEKPHGLIERQGKVAIVYIADLSSHLSLLAGRLYAHHDNQLIAVTGTNGKTTITQLIAQWLELVEQRAAVMGTTGNGFLDNLQPAANTTGNAVEVQRTIAELAQLGANYTALEVSSHGLVQGRVKALSFVAGVFTNLSRDHLDYHGTMEEYAEAKFALFSQHQCQHAIINADDEVGKRWVARLDNAIAVSLLPQVAVDGAPMVWANQVCYSEQGIDIEFDGHFGAGHISAPLIGEFNASNVMLAMTTLLALGIDKQALINTAEKLEPVLGRMELFATQGKAKVVVDYAHTPDALEKALLALRVHCEGQLWAIFGCGGDRDKGKRPMMAEIGERLADRVILSDDNPRSENPAEIVQDMLAGMNKPQQAIVEHQRFTALQRALNEAGEQDIILLAGKGHEDYQVLADQTVHYSDRESAQQLLGLLS
ncbi:UDP-N-acetylmuramoylalanyl-D-glutamate--2,6-diaminopimelate ligase [Vibrio ichthyoenteri ATCC 700023]|uniref:UDP-N-acetylmuramoyl-L-alanyl-D-glutamate--2,6-diaminopimelate ligase n=1 Tax=Vibrio ichthyoenteri ATCC 700023 TaxID=870968 RepID=F9RWT7_9VIBR|nr:UDP-N-acetylmuramoyl-L-alanyl-D-glutamate--2,6-diaminopimelate ligase [Vibrio ichthyoenteri]EGU48851.1 UDP-N-acetylmuramoylalanyl-D-glutamate--2,6-diaminopimelate ligase [Vibrio ichthyoenteri ATCC 700023]